MAPVSPRSSLRLQGQKQTKLVTGVPHRHLVPMILLAQVQIFAGCVSSLGQKVPNHTFETENMVSGPVATAQTIMRDNTAWGKRAIGSYQRQGRLGVSCVQLKFTNSPLLLGKM